MIVEDERQSIVDAEHLKLLVFAYVIEGATFATFSVFGLFFAAEGASVARRSWCHRSKDSLRHPTSAGSSDSLDSLCLACSSSAARSSFSAPIVCGPGGRALCASWSLRSHA